MNRTERLLDLIAYLINAPQPVSFAEVQESFPDAYEGSEDAAIRKFERDKATLLELGIPLRWVEGDDIDGASGYVIDRDKFYLPEIDLTPEEMAVVYLAGTSVLSNEAFPYRRDLERALQKISLRTSADASSRPGVVMHQGGAADRDVAEQLGQIEQALATRKRIDMAYTTQLTGVRRERSVDPYAVVCREGSWSLIGYCHDRSDVRVFSVHRIDELQINAVKPKTPDFEIPADFVLKKYINVKPWNYDRHEPLEVTFDVTAELAFMAEQHFGISATGSEGMWTRFSLTATNTDVVVQWVLGMGPNAKIVSPVEIRDRVKQSLEALVERYDHA